MHLYENQIPLKRNTLAIELGVVQCILVEVYKVDKLINEVDLMINFNFIFCRLCSQDEITGTGNSAPADDWSGFGDQIQVSGVYVLCFQV